MSKPAPLTITVMGSGTSVGVPTIGCTCRVCSSADPRDQRLRPSVALRWDNYCAVIDAGPDFRQQVLRARLPRLDAVLFTHAHADHILGLDDLRPFNFHQSQPIAIWSTASTLDTIQRVFSYIFHDGPTESSRPKIAPQIFDRDPFAIGGLTFTPIPLKHGNGPCHGFRFGRAAYLTDHSVIPEESMALLEGLDVLFLDALRHKPHPTHSTVATSLKAVERLQPRRAYFTHVSHDLRHEETQAKLPPNVHLAYDTLEIEVEVEVEAASAA
jgi:phosphoribosyl 1,2-cyclic phosphate phosphodiesterase